MSPSFNAYLVLFIAAFNSLTQAGEPDKKDLQIPDGLKALQHPDPLVRYKAAEILARLGKTAKFAIPELREALKDKDVRVRIKAAEALWKVEQPPPSRILPLLLAALKDREPTVRAAVPRVLALLGAKAKPAMPALTQALADKDLHVRMETVLALGELGPVAAGAARPLLKMTADADFPLLEPMISVTLGNLGATAVPALEEALARKEIEARRMAAYSLGLIGPPARKAAPSLCRALTDREAGVRAQVAQALGNFGKDAIDCVADIKKALRDGDPGVRIEAGLALWRIAQSRAGLPGMTSALKKSAQALVRERACKALGQMGTAASEALPALLGGLEDPEASVRAASADALAEMPLTKSAIESLTRALNDNDVHVQLSAVRAVARDDHAIPACLPVLRKALKNGDPAVRIRAANTSAEFTGPHARSVVPLLVEALDDDHREVQEAAARTLKKIDPKAAAAAGVR